MRRGSASTCPRRWANRFSPAHNRSRLALSIRFERGEPMTRHLLKLAAVTSLAATAALVGCGKKEEPAPQAAAPASAAAPAKKEPLTIAFAYERPVGDAGVTCANDMRRNVTEKAAR